MRYGILSTGNGHILLLKVYWVWRKTFRGTVILNDYPSIRVTPYVHQPTAYSTKWLKHNLVFISRKKAKEVITQGYLPKDVKWYIS